MTVLRTYSLVRNGLEESAREDHVSLEHVVFDMDNLTYSSICPVCNDPEMPQRGSCPKCGYILGDTIEQMIEKFKAANQ